MKSGKSYDLISFFAPLQYSTIPFSLYQSARNVRDEQIYSRNGVGLKAQKIASFKELFPVSSSIELAIDQHMISHQLKNIFKENVKVTSFVDYYDNIRNIYNDILLVELMHVSLHASIT
jgi:hypothetical protein